ncbi:FeoB-associated Cys-rich membrane protein [uncultured Megasphaera sp.]|uniref:FeoB-associated Cys-rich membrane protein n=1 Tax=uncultured Megasphaera sp. TaxID=165188 RepID=UPI0028042B99|nr:FeoB-associated Cys-rich membrane protein [uncultured Megasphaera sp.]
MSPATIIVAIVVVIAVAYFVHHIRGLFNGTASCCSNCSACVTSKDDKKNSKLPPCCQK